MKILHTSDWHLGRVLYQRQRYEEFTHFLTWLLDFIEQQQIDALLIAGDIFDTTTPSHRAQQLYYQFLANVANTCCRHVVIIAGNHDSPSLLEAPKRLLQAIDVHVVGEISDNIADELIALCSETGELEAIIAAVPYLRDRDIRKAEVGESIADKSKKLIAGIQQHYAAISQLAEQFRGNAAIPFITMGHLFTSGGRLAEGDGVRDLYIGSLAHVGEHIFPSNIDYLALGHLHIAQKIAGKTHFRYSGSPISMGFGEIQQDKSVVVVAFSARTPTIHLHPVPCFQRLAKIAGNATELKAIIQALCHQQQSIWLDVEYTGNELVGDLREQIDEWVANSAVEVLRLRQQRCYVPLSALQAEEVLSDLTPHEVFERCLVSRDIPSEQHEQLWQLHNEILQSLHEADKQAE